MREGMRDDVAVRAVGLGKQYHIGALLDRDSTLGERITRSATAPFRRAWKLVRGQATGAAELDETIWALKDIDFEVKRGEVVGFIGPNGAGKSTLLKVLSRITEPTEGMAEVRGRVSSLLEVGTGFHPELTGRENVYLNGAILGMTREEINRKFDRIVAFSGVERFIDTPVKHYSSGMSVRLAFAVAGHLEPEVLVIDEVLSVGDAAFQRKCLGRMEEVAGRGRTVLFVSHNMGAVADLCERVFLLEHGRIVRSGDPAEVISAYLASGYEESGEWSRGEREDREGDTDGGGAVESVHLRGPEGEKTAVLRFDRPFQVVIRYRLTERMRNLAVVCGVKDRMGNLVFQSWDIDDTDLAGAVREPGLYESVCTIPPRLLAPGGYALNVAMHIPNVRWVDVNPDIFSFEVSEVGYTFESGRRGIVSPVLEWEVHEVGVDSPILT